MHFFNLIVFFYGKGTQALYFFPIEIYCTKEVLNTTPFEAFIIIVSKL